MQDATEIMQELQHQRLVQPQFMANGGDGCRCSAAAGDQYGRIGRQCVEQQEGDGADAEQDECRLNKSAENEKGHQPRPLWVGSRMSRSASPTRLNDKAVSRITAPGMNTNQGADSK